MKWGILFRWRSLWIGAHWSPYNRRLCINLLPMITLWIVWPGGTDPKDEVTLDVKKMAAAIKALSTNSLLLAEKKVNPLTQLQFSNDIPGMRNANVWIEAGNYSNRAAELRITVTDPLPNGFEDFWIPFSAAEGDALGWIRFSYITSITGRAMFGATEWRSALEPAPAEQDRLPLPVASVPAGFSPPL